MRHLTSKDQINDDRIIGMRHLTSKNQINLYSVGPTPVGLMLKELLASATKRVNIKSIWSGDSSVVTRWTVDQEVVGSNPTHGANLISVMCSLSGFTQPIEYITFSHHEKWNNCLLPYRTVIA